LLAIGVFSHHLGTSNWSQDYYTRTAGVGFVMESVSKRDAKKFEKDAKNREKEKQSDEDSAQISDELVVKDLRDQLVDVFNRDWQSPHCKFVK
jgi:hypothetical protein